MNRDILFLGLKSGKSKKGNDYNICSFAMENNNKEFGYDTYNSFIQDAEVLTALQHHDFMETIKANIYFVNNGGGSSSVLIVSVD